MGLLNDKFAPITSSIGVIKAPLQETKDSFIQWENGILSKYNQAVTETPLKCEFGEAMNRLPPLVRGVRTRYLLLALGNEWTAFFDNGHHGTDPAGVIAVMSIKLHTTTLSLTLRPNTVQSDFKNAKPGTYGAVIFQAHEDSQKSRRSIACANDGGRWVFEQYGIPYAFEDSSSYENKMVSKRFGPDLLKKYVLEFGVCPFSDAAYLNQDGLVQGVLIAKVGNLPKTLTFVSLAEARKALGIE